MKLSSQMTKRWVTPALLAVCLVVPSAASAQRRKPKPTPPPPATAAPSATPTVVESPPPAAPPAPVEPPPAPTVVEPPPPAPAPAPAPAASAPAPAASVAVETHIKPAPPAPPVVRTVTTPVVVSGVIAGLGVASGIVFAIFAAGDHGKYVDKPDHDVALSGERNAFIADVSFGVAALFGLTALALYMLPDEPSPTEPAKATRPKSPTWVSSALKGQVFSF